MDNLKFVYAEADSSEITRILCLDYLYYGFTVLSNQTLKVRDTIHSYQLFARRERGSFLLRNVPLCRFCIWIASFGQTLAIIGFTAILRPIITHMKILQTGDHSIVSDAGFFFPPQGIITSKE